MPRGLVLVPVLALLHVILVNLQRTDAWIATPNNSIITRRRHQSVALVQCEKLSETPSSLFQKKGISRRDWFSAIGGASIVLVGRETCPPANAAAPRLVVTTKNTCDPSVSVWEQPSTNRKVYLLGTAHISSESANLAGRLVEDVHPNAVFLELDAKRVKLSPEEEAALRLPIEEIEKQNKAEKFIRGPTMEEPPTAVTASSLGWNEKAMEVAGEKTVNSFGSMYDKLGSEGFQPGEEFIVAARAGHKIGAFIVLGDRDVEVTVRRLSLAVAQTDVKKLLRPNNGLEQVMKSVSKVPNERDKEYKEELTEYVEAIKAKETIKAIMEQLNSAAPEYYRALVKERDEYMGNGLDQLNSFPDIVAVMGMAHIDGVEQFLEKRGWRRAPLVCKI